MGAAATGDSKVSFGSTPMIICMRAAASLAGSFVVSSRKENSFRIVFFFVRIRMRFLHVSRLERPFVNDFGLMNISRFRVESLINESAKEKETFMRLFHLCARSKREREKSAQNFFFVSRFILSILMPFCPFHVFTPWAISEDGRAFISSLARPERLEQKEKHAALIK